MSNFWHAPAAAGIMLALAATLSAGDQADVRAVIDKAVKAHGGEANLAKYPAVIMKGSGTFYGIGDGAPYSGEWANHGLKRNRFLLESKFMDMSFKVLRVIDGDKAWIKINDEEPKDLTKEELAEEKEQMYAGWVAKLAPLKDKAFTLAALGEAQVHGKPAVGVRVSSAGHRDVNLFFDKTGGLLVKTEARIKDVRAGDKEYNQEIFYHDYKTIQGMQIAVKILLHRDGKRFVEGVMSEVRPMEKLDAGLFARP